MHRGVVVACGVAACVAAAVMGWNDVRHERSFRRLLAAGDQALSAGETSSAVEAFSGAVALKPQAMLPYLKRGDTYLHRGDWAAAERDLRQATALDPTAPQPHERLGDAALAAGRFADATVSYRQSLALEDRAPLVLHKLALAYYFAGNVAAAVSTTDAGLALDARAAETWTLRGLALADLDRRADARDALVRAVDLAPTARAPRLALASLFEADGRTQEALALREAVAALSTDGPEPLLSLAAAYQRTGHVDQAEAALARAAERHPGSEAVARGRAKLWLEAAGAGTAEHAARRVVVLLGPLAERADASGDLLTLYGRALLLDGSLALAERALQRAVQQSPVPGDAFALLAEASTRRGHAAAGAHARAQHAALSTGP